MTRKFAPPPPPPPPTKHDPSRSNIAQRSAAAVPVASFTAVRHVPPGPVYGPARPATAVRHSPPAVHSAGANGGKTIQGLFVGGSFRAPSTTGAIQPKQVGWTAALPGTFNCPPNFRLPQQGGKSLPETVRHEMEEHFRADFSGVRVHVGPEPAEIGALAFTIGERIFFNPSSYAPDTFRGKQILAHELAHVLQQRSGKVQQPRGTGYVIIQDRALEAEADQLSRAVLMRRAVPHQPISSPKPGMPQARSSAIQRSAMVNFDEGLDVNLSIEGRPGGKQHAHNSSYALHTHHFNREESIELYLAIMDALDHAEQVAPEAAKKHNKLEGVARDLYYLNQRMTEGEENIVKLMGVGQSGLSELVEDIISEQNASHYAKLERLVQAPKGEGALISESLTFLKTYQSGNQTTSDDTIVGHAVRLLDIDNINEAMKSGKLFSPKTGSVVVKKGVGVKIDNEYKLRVAAGHFNEVINNFDRIPIDNPGAVEKFMDALASGLLIDKGALFGQIKGHRAFNPDKYTKL